MANDTLDCLEVGVLETSGNRVVFVEVELEIFWLNTNYRTMLSPEKYPAAGAATRTTAE